MRTFPAGAGRKPFGEVAGASNRRCVVASHLLCPAIDRLCTDITDLDITQRPASRDNIVILRIGDEGQGQASPRSRDAMPSDRDTIDHAGWPLRDVEIGCSGDVGAKSVDGGA